MKPRIDSRGGMSGPVRKTRAPAASAGAGGELRRWLRSAIRQSGLPTTLSRTPRRD